MKIVSQKILTAGTSELTVGVLQDFVHGLPSEARLDVKQSTADRPGEMSTVTISVSNEESIPRRVTN